MMRGKKECFICGQPRFKPDMKDNTKQSNVPYKVLRYFPLTPRLQRLYISRKSARHIRWHKEGVHHDLAVVSYLVHGETWKQFDLMHPDFASEYRNIRLWLCTNGFIPFANNSACYSC